MTTRTLTQNYLTTWQSDCSDVDIEGLYVGLDASGVDTPAGAAFRENNYDFNKVELAIPRCTYGNSATGVEKTCGGNLCYVRFEYARPHVATYSMTGLNGKREKATRKLMLQSRLLEKVRGHNWAAAVDLAELNQTVQLAIDALGVITGSARSLNKTIDTFFLARNGKKHHRRKLTWNDISNAWLQTVYGVLPTMSSAYEAARYFERKLIAARPARFAASTRFADEVGARTVTGVYVPDLGTAEVFQKVTWKITPDWQGFNSWQELGFSNPAYVAWNRFPFSWIVDWFSPISTFLELRHLTALIPGTEIYSETTTVFLRPTGSEMSRATFDGRLISPNAYGILHGPCFFRSKGFSRRCYPIGSGVSLPPVKLYLPSGRRLATSIALAHQQVSRLMTNAARL